jgi:hypothetical protein
MRRRSVIRACGGAAAVHSVLQHLGRLEDQLLGRGDLDGFTGRRVAAGAGRLGLNLELAETGQGDFLALGRGVADSVEEGIDQGLGLGLGDAAGGGDLVGEVRGVHFNSLL